MSELRPWFRGGKYKVRYRLSNQRYDREMVAVYLGRNNTALIGRPYQFSGRPEFGTTELQPQDIIANERVPDHTQCYVDRRAPTS